MENQIEYVPLQKCPKCDGQGTVSKPPHLAGDIETWSSCSFGAHKCNLCEGKMVIPMHFKHS